jgi:hypothetical protein
MTKFCVVLYGPLRTWTRTKDSFVEKILDAVYPVVPDIFVHTYDRNDSTNEIYYSQKDVNELMVFPLKDGKSLKPKLIVVEKFDEVMAQNLEESKELFNRGSSRNTPRVYSDVKKIYRAYQDMKKYDKYVNYEYMMFARFDVKYKNWAPGHSHDKFNFHDIKDENTLYNFHTGSPDPADECVFGFPKSLDVFASRYEQIFNVPTEHLEFGAVPTDNPYLLLRYCCNKFFGRDWSWFSLGYAEIQN